MSKAKMKLKKQLVGFIAVLSGIAFLILLTGSCLAVVDVGKNGVVSGPTGEVRDIVLTPGFHLKWPWERVTAYPVTTRTVSLTHPSEDGEKRDEALTVQTADGRTVKVEVVYSYHMDPERLVQAYQKSGGLGSEGWEQGELKLQLKLALQAVATRYHAIDIYSERREQVSAEAKKHLSSILQKDGIVLESIALLDVHVDSQTKKALQAAHDAQKRMEYLKQVEAIKRQEARNRQLEAEAKKKEIVIQAEAQAEANRILRKSLSRSILEYEKIKKWDGKSSLKP